MQESLDKPDRILKSSLLCPPTLPVALGFLCLSGSLWVTSMPSELGWERKGDQLELRFRGTPEFYFQLEVANNPTFADAIPLRMALSGDSVVWSLPLSEQNWGFFRVRSVEVADPEDRDRDGLNDLFELGFPSILDPLDPSDAGRDLDADGLATREELLRWGTDPTRSDTDGDGWSDSAEVSAESQPANPAQRPETVVIPAVEVSIDRAGVMVSGVEVSIDRAGVVAAKPEVEVYPIRTRIPEN